jgi:hypothetical protein
VIFLFAQAAAIAADEQPTPPAQSEKSIYAEQPKCRAWTDECVNCSRGENGGAPMCSNIGTACQPKAIRCVEAEPAEPPPAAPPRDDKTKAPQ